ncbi:subclass B3 metallo-beta-lactamase [Sphingomonas sp. Leaf22]|uniref:subclass B3 metallo-beta-lactamase n=1 Tax=Sphingomonas sp. Leaf22 TaxID=1735687 RepID=UPI000701627B|nr:subclass B3 metallo-beta-lactamase [Sphingomonas sp. Leaf22]KQM95304.1 subclass B3 metallo-beta-lactamase [Sphingomonas sp. Leaf22]
MIGAILLAATLTAAPPADVTARARQCAGKDGWSDPAPPVRIFGNVYDIGTCGITVLLIAGPRGHVVIDAATAEAVPSIVNNIRKLGFRPQDVKLLLMSHSHIDHAGGLAALRRATGAKLRASAAAREVIERGRFAADDPQRDILSPVDRVPVAGVLTDGQSVTLGPIRLTAHLTPGHSPDGMSWSWRSCAGTVCRTIVFADSLSAVSSDAYRFRDHPAYVARLRATIARVAALPCDIVLTPHPGASDMAERLAGQKPLVDRNGCRAYADAATRRLDKRLADEAR